MVGLVRMSYLGTGRSKLLFSLWWGRRCEMQFQKLTMIGRKFFEEEAESDDDDKDAAFYGANSLLNTDQGIRGLLVVTNDLCYVQSEQLELESWFSSDSSGASDQEAIDEELESLNQHYVAGFLDELCFALAKFDWRTSAAPDLTEEERVLKTAYRGGSGYRELRRQLLNHLRNESGRVAEAAEDVLSLIGYE